MSRINIHNFSNYLSQGDTPKKLFYSITQQGHKLGIIKVAQPFVGEDEIQAIKKVLLSGQYISGKKVNEFEKLFAEYHEVKYSVALNSGTAALHVALSVIGVGPGDEVIVPPLTFFSTITSVLHQYAIPIFADIDPVGFCLDPIDIEKRITEKTKAIIPVHLYGNSAKINEIIKIAKKYEIRVIEDCAQSHGTEFRGKKVGTFGDIGAFSFFATKHMTTGEGGIMITNNKQWADLAKRIRSHGMIDRDHHDYLGYNYRMSEIAAAMGVEQLKKLDKHNEKRIEHSKYLIEELRHRNISWLKTPKLENQIKHTFFWFPILIEEEKLGMSTKDLIKILKKKGIETRHRYYQPLYKQKILVDKENYPHRILFTSSNIDYSKIYLENAEKVAGKIIGLPNHIGLEKKDLDYIVDTIYHVI